MTRSGGWILVAIAVLAGASTACGRPESQSASSTSTMAPSVLPSPAASMNHSETPTSDVTTLRTLIAAQPESPTLTIEEELDAADGYRTSAVSYQSDGLTIRGVLHTPDGDGPFPGVVFVHGAVDRDTWSPIVQLVDEQRRLVTAGYVVLVPDLRNHGDSDDDADYPTDLEMGTSADVVNAARALGEVPGVDPERVAVVGISFGGVMTFNAMVVAPEVAAAFVAMAPGSLSAWENFSRFIPADSPAYQGMVDLRGTPDTNPEFWTDVSASTFVDRAARPLVIVQGMADQVVPPAWAEDTRRAFEEAGKDVELVALDGADHDFEPARDEAWGHVLAFLATHLAP